MVSRAVTVSRYDITLTVDSVYETDSVEPDNSHPNLLLIAVGPEFPRIISVVESQNGNFLFLKFSFAKCV